MLSFCLYISAVLLSLAELQVKNKPNKTNLTFKLSVEKVGSYDTSRGLCATVPRCKVLEQRTMMLEGLTCKDKAKDFANISYKDNNIRNRQTNLFRKCRKWERFNAVHYLVAVHKSQLQVAVV